MAEGPEHIDNGEVRSSNNEIGPVLNLTSEPLDSRCPFYKDSQWFINPQRKRGRCTSCDGRLFEVPKCETGNPYLLEDHCNASLWRLKQVLDERVRQEESQCVELKGPHEQTCPLVEVGQLLEQGLFDTEDLSANDKVSQQVGPQDDNRGPNPVPMKYCTQKCMFGLKRRRELDSGCPNVTAHRQGKNTNSHQIDNLQLSSLLTTQLALDRNNGCTLLKLGALPGRIHAEDKHVIFRLTLISHGYTFIGKATQMSSVMKLKREKEAYLVLRKMQGEKVPVLLGDLYFAKPWSLRPEAIRLSSGSEMVYMLLLAYAGNRLMH